MEIQGGLDFSVFSVFFCIFSESIYITVFEGFRCRRRRENDEKVMRAMEFSWNSSESQGVARFYKVLGLPGDLDMGWIFLDSPGFSGFSESIYVTVLKDFDAADGEKMMKK